MSREAENPEDPIERLSYTLPKSMVAAIENYRFEHRIPSRSETIRELIKAGLESKLRSHRSRTEKGGSD